MCRDKRKGIHSRSCESKRNGRPTDPARSCLTTYITMNSSIESTNIDSVNTCILHVCCLQLPFYPASSVYPVWIPYIHTVCGISWYVSFSWLVTAIKMEREIKGPSGSYHTAHSFTVLFIDTKYTFSNDVVKSIHIASHPPCMLLRVSINRPCSGNK